MTGYEFYDDFGPHFYRILDKKDLYLSIRSAHSPQCLDALLISIYAAL